MFWPLQVRSFWHLLSEEPISMYLPSHSNLKPYASYVVLDHPNKTHNTFQTKLRENYCSLLLNLNPQYRIRPYVISRLQWKQNEITFCIHQGGLLTLSLFHTSFQTRTYVQTQGRKEVDTAQLEWYEHYNKKGLANQRPKVYQGSLTTIIWFKGPNISRYVHAY